METIVPHIMEPIVPYVIGLDELPLEIENHEQEIHGKDTLKELNAAVIRQDIVTRRKKPVQNIGDQLQKARFQIESWTKEAIRDLEQEKVRGLIESERTSEELKAKYGLWFRS